MGLAIKTTNVKSHNNMRVDTPLRAVYRADEPLSRTNRDQVSILHLNYNVMYVNAMA